MAAIAAASGTYIIWRSTRSSAIEREPDRVEWEDLGAQQSVPEPDAAECVAWQDRAVAEKEAAEAERRATVASTHAWERAVREQGRITVELACSVWETNSALDIMVFEPRMEEEREVAGRVETADGEFEVDEHIVMDMPP